MRLRFAKTLTFCKTIGAIVLESQLVGHTGAVVKNCFFCAREKRVLWLVKHAPSRGTMSQSHDQKVHGCQGSRRFPLPWELPAPTKQEATVWGRLGSGRVGASAVAVHQVVSLYSQRLTEQPHCQCVSSVMCSCEVVLFVPL